MRYVRQSPEEVRYRAVSRGSSQTYFPGWVLDHPHVSASSVRARQPQPGPADAVPQDAWLGGGPGRTQVLSREDGTPRHFDVGQSVGR